MHKIIVEIQYCDRDDDGIQYPKSYGIAEMHFESYEEVLKNLESIVKKAFSLSREHFEVCTVQAKEISERYFGEEK